MHMYPSDWNRGVDMRQRKARCERMSLPGWLASAAMLATTAFGLCLLDPRPAVAGGAISNCADLDTSGSGTASVGAFNVFVAAAPGDQIRVEKTNAAAIGLSPNIRVTPPGSTSSELPLPVTIDVGAGQAGTWNIDDDPFNASITVVCIVGGATPGGGNDVVVKAQSGINNFLKNRGTQILNSDPDLADRRSGGVPGGGSGSVGPSGAVGFSARGTSGNAVVGLSTSLRQVMRANAAAKAEKRRELAGRMGLGHRGSKDSLAPIYDDEGWDVWVKGSWTQVDRETSKTDVGIVHAGVDYRFNSSLVIGLMAQYDWADEDDATNAFSIDGEGWMIGPYVVAQLTDQVVFQGRVAYGESDNDVSPTNTFTDSFDTQRWLAKGQLEGTLQGDGFTVTPHVAVTWFHETSDSYVDSNGNTIAGQTSDIGRLTFGPTWSTSYTTAAGITLTPTFGISGVWDFEAPEILDLSTGTATGDDSFRARLDGGLAVSLADGVSVTGSGFYDGIGADDFSAYGGSLRVRMSLQ